MRADRLVALLLLLQQREQVTAAEAAAELEVSERTARRDLEALGLAGVPIYSRPGRNGGWRLIGGARTDLSGLNAAEVRALFLLAGPSSAATPEVKTALRKLVRALPEPFRPDAEAASGAVIVDRHGWDRVGSKPRTPFHLDALQQAVISGVQVDLAYVARDGAATRRIVHPLGLATKADVWYLVADTDAGLRTFRVDRVTGAEPTGDAAVRPDGFDLAAAWRMIAAEIDEKRTPVRARGRIAPEAIGWLRMTFGGRARIGPAGDDGWIECEVRGSNVRGIAAELAGFGGLVEIAEPHAVRAELAQLGAELAASYGSAGS